LTRRAAPPDVVILCGGRGLRLRPVLGVRPKVLADIGGRPFLRLLVDRLMGRGFHRFIFCTGIGSKQIERYWTVAGPVRAEAQLTFSREERPLGTAGAVRYARPKIRTDPFLVINGDSICDLDYRRLIEFHRKTAARVTVALAPAGLAGGSPRRDGGNVRLDRTSAISQFEEKKSGGSVRYINAGVYVFQRSVLDQIPPGKASSLEKELFPNLIGKGLYGFPGRVPLFDIGTPERLRAFRNLFLRRKRVRASGKP